MRFQDKKVMVTGGANGIGRATALEFAREGATVAIVDIDEAGAKAAAAEIAAAGGTASVHVVDVSDEAAVTALFAGLSTLDVAINCAGVSEGNGPISELSLLQLQRTLAVNVEGLFLSLRAELALMRKQGHGAIVNVTGLLAHEGKAGFSAYAAASHAIAGMTKSAALEAARDNVQINAVSPGFVDTAMLQAFFAGKPADLAALPDTLPKGRLQTPAQIARAILFLASEDAAQFIGSSLKIDGGATDAQSSTLWVYPKLASDAA